MSASSPNNYPMISGGSGAMSPVASSGVISVTLPGSTSYAEEAKCDREYEKEFRETFSKGLLRLRIEEYHAGKLTKRYLDAYLEFMHLSAMVSNLEYLEFKEALAKE